MRLCGSGNMVSILALDRRGVRFLCLETREMRGMWN